VEHRQKLVQLARREPLWGETAIEFLLDLLDARSAVEHLQQRVLFFLKTKVP
jgi:hypothetical protein